MPIVETWTSPCGRRRDRLLDIGDAAEAGRREAVTDVEHPALAVARPSSSASTGAQRGDDVARTRRRLRARASSCSSPAAAVDGARRSPMRAAVAVAHEHGEPIAAIHLVDHRDGELARAREALADHRLAAVDDDHVVARLGLAPARQLRRQREHRGRARVGGDDASARRRPSDRCRRSSSPASLSSGPAAAPPANVHARSSASPSAR